MRSIRPLLLLLLSVWFLVAGAAARADVAPQSMTIMPRAMIPRLPPPPSPLTQMPALHMPAPPMLLSGADPGLQCRRAVTLAGRAAGIPDHLMSAIARVESGRRGADGQVNPWPWSINVEGTDHIYDTREQAIAAVRAYQAQGIRSIDVGCMQVNLLHHPNAFATLEQAFEPQANANYAAQFLKELLAQTGSWEKATAGYHSQTPELGEPYQRKVASVMGEEAGRDAALLGAMPGLPPAQGMRLAMGATPPAPATALAMPPAAARILGNHSDVARIIPMANTAAGRGLDAYRAAPVRVAGRP
jgi:hypothetical protein